MPTDDLQRRRSPPDDAVAPFWSALADHDDAPAIFEASTGRAWTYRQLATEIATGAEQLASPKKRLILICAANTADFARVHLSALQAGHAVLLASHPLGHPSSAALLALYRPDTVFWTGDAPSGFGGVYAPAAPLFGLRQLRRLAPSTEPLDGELALALPTSGTSGSPKTARLSACAISANAHQIRLGLGLDPSSCAVAALPFAHVFGLSILHSQLACGGSVVVGAPSVTDPGFCEMIRRYRVSTLPGVSLTFDLLRKLQFERWPLPDLRQLLHSGSRLNPPTLAWLRDTLAERLDVRLMYGMTEAAGRLCIPEPGLISAKPQSVGRPAAWSEITATADARLVVCGPNVMLGYAQSRSDLARGDDQHGVFDTGDLGRIDEDGDVYVTGRTSRIFKVMGRRYSLDDVEARFHDLTTGPAVVRGEDALVLFHTDGSTVELDARISEVARAFGLPTGMLRREPIERIPLTSTGKVAYERLTPPATTGARAWSILD
jgi:acyl-coenzyme A synthetase/AMP-(fatty) acid ligase